MLCYRCGTHLPEGNDTCPSCGQKFTGRTRALSVTEKARLVDKYREGVRKTHPGMVYDVGAVLADRYVLEEVIGSGGLGVVYRAYDRAIEVRVAVKVIAPKIIHTQEEQRHFVKYVKAAKHLSHPNIIQIYEIGEIEGNHFIVMQFVEGLPLGKIVTLRQEKGQSLGLAELEPIVVQMAQALDSAHTVTYHGNLKPDNVIIQPDFLKMTDFCLDRAIPHKPFIAIQRSKGRNLRYVAPEIRSAAGRGDARSDIYSLGIMLGELLCGEIYSGQPEDLRLYMAKLPKGFSDVFAQAVLLDPRRRYNSAGEIAEDVVSIIHGEELPARTAVPEFPSAPPPLPSERGEAEEEDLDAAYILGPKPLAQPAAAEEDKIPTPVPMAAAPPPPAEPAPVPAADIHKMETRITAAGAKPLEQAKPSPKPLKALAEEAEEKPRSWRLKEAQFAAPEELPARRRAAPLFTIMAASLAVVVVIAGAIYGLKSISRKEPPPAPSGSAEQTPRAGVPAATAPVPEKRAMAADAGPKQESMEGKKLAELDIQKPEEKLTSKTQEAETEAETKKEPLAVASAEQKQAKPEKTRKTEKPKPPEPVRKPAKPGAEVDVWEKRTEPAAPSSPQPAAEPPAPPVAQPSQPAPPFEPPEQEQPGEAVASLAPAQPAPGVKTKCPAGMAYITPGQFKMGSATNDPMRGFGEKELTDTDTPALCIDYYEYPNIRGEIPKTDVTLSEAAALCGKKGKRLCTEEEWEKACKGLGSYRYPYGNKFETNKCNTLESGANALSTAGSFVMCRSGYGIYDMSGNAAEWTASSWATNISDKVIRGGDAQKPNWASRCAYKTNRNSASRDPMIGFRCCADPK